MGYVKKDGGPGLAQGPLFANPCSSVFVSHTKYFYSRRKGHKIQDVLSARDLVLSDPPVVAFTLSLEVRLTMALSGYAVQVDFNALSQLAQMFTLC